METKKTDHLFNKMKEADANTSRYVRNLWASVLRKDKDAFSTNLLLLLRTAEKVGLKRGNQEEQRRMSYQHPHDQADGHFN